MLFIPNQYEETMMQEIIDRSRSEYALIRLTETMLNKSIIDASGQFRSVIKINNIMDYSLMFSGGEKLYMNGLLLTKHVEEIKISFYRPMTKNGDPRFWIYGLKNILRPNDMIYISTFDGKLVVIPLVDKYFSTDTLDQVFKNEGIRIRKELFELLINLKNRGDILSVSPLKSNPKDVGETFEQELGISPNTRILADYKNKIELKAKRDGSGTMDTLFSMVPDWNNSNIKKSSEMLLTYGYPSNKPQYKGYIDLYVTVNNKANNQGLYLEVDDNNNLLHQMHTDRDTKVVSTCVWNFNDIKTRLYEKHPETVWVIAKEIRKNGLIYFIYDNVEFTQRPIFSSFILQISKGIVTYDWRGRVRTDGTGYKDKGHCFRIFPKHRNTIFGNNRTIDLT